MAKRSYIIDTADVVTTRKSDNHTVFTGTAETAGFNIDAESETQRGGIGNKGIFKYSHSKEVELNITDVLFDLDYLATTQGVEVNKEEKTTIKRTEKDLEVSGQGEDLEVSIKGGNKGEDVVLINKDGETETVSGASGTVTIPKDFAKEGERVTAIYKEEVNGNVVNIDADKFSESYEIQYHTIEYDPDNNKVINDIYFIFENVVFDAEFELSLEAGEALTPELSMEAMAAPGSEKIGRIVQVPRKDK